MPNDTAFPKFPKSLAARPDLPAATKLVYAALADRMGTNGHCWPGYDRLGRDRKRTP